MSVPAALVAVALGLPVLFLGAAPAQAAAPFVETNPSTARPGDQIGIRAGCTDNLNAGTVKSGPLGTLTVQPRYGFLTATTQVPLGTKVGDYKITLTCPDRKTATSTFHVVARVTPTRGPATGGGGTAPGRSAPMLIGGGLTAIVAGLTLAVTALRRRRFS
jgi:hypothetical protein